MLLLLAGANMRDEGHGTTVPAVNHTALEPGGSPAANALEPAGHVRAAGVVCH